MTEKIDSTKVVRDISLLYELSLAVGNSLDLRKNCEIFLKTLMARKNLAFASVWIRPEYLPDSEASEGVVLVYANPEFRIKTRQISDDHPLVTYLADRLAFSLSSADSDFSKIVTEKDITTGTFAVFALGEIGMLKIYSPTRTEPFDNRELGQLAKVIDKFAVSLEGSLAHQRSLREIAERKSAEEAVRQSELLLRSIIDATPDWIFIKDQEHRYRLANQGYAQALHMKPEDFIGKNDLELGFPEELVKGDPDKGIRGFWADDRLVMDSGETQVYPDDPATIDGVVHTFHTIKTPLQDADGEVWGVLAFARDITDRTQAEEMLAKRAAELETVAYVSTAASTILNPDKLLQEVVDLTKERFGLYHAHIYLLNENGDRVKGYRPNLSNGDQI